MLFSSLTFLYAFLPLTLLCYALCKSTRQKNILLLCASLVFYAWGAPAYVLLLLGMSLADWYIALRIEAVREARRKGLWLFAACLVNLGLLGFFKYSGLICSVFGEVPEFISKIALPLGISFYTFQLLSYVADVKRGEVKAQERYFNLLLYAALFHQCIAGPIVRYKSIEHELYTERSARASAAEGVRRFAVGLGKKVLLGNACGALCDTLLLSDAAINGAMPLAEAVDKLAAAPVLAIWLGMAAYMLHIYFDFSGYSDMAIGLGLMIGLHYPENFNYPYAARSVTDFWHRWHISLSGFFRDYVYIPLGGSRKGVGRTLLNLFIVWGLTGLWHGASWTFALWGLYYFVFLSLEKLFLKRRLDSEPAFFPRLYTLLVVFFGWVIFKFSDMELLTTALKGMIGLNGNELINYQVKLWFSNRYILLIVAAVFATPLFAGIQNMLTRLCAERRYARGLLFSLRYFVLPTAVLLLSTAMLVGGSYNPFIYFHF